MLRRDVLVQFSAAASVFATSVRPAGAAGTLEKVRLTAIPSDALTPLYYALQTGAFRRAGIDLEITPAMTGTAATTAVIAGAYDIANSSLIPVMAAHLKGIAITIVAPQAVYTAENPFALLQVAPDATFKTGNDLNGKIVAVSALNDSSQLSISAWVEKNGGDAASLKFVEVPTVATDEAIAQHRVAAGLLLEPMLDSSLLAGRTKTLGDAYGAIARTFMFAAYVGRPDWAKNNADLLRRFVLVAGQAAAYTNTHPADTASMMSDITKIPLPVMQRMKRVVCATSLDARLVQPVIDTAAKFKQIGRSFPAKELFFSNTA